MRGIPLHTLPQNQHSTADNSPSQHSRTKKFVWNHFINNLPKVPSLVQPEKENGSLKVMGKRELMWVTLHNCMCHSHHYNFTACNHKIWISNSSAMNVMITNLACSSQCFNLKPYTCSSGEDYHTHMHTLGKKNCTRNRLHSSLCRLKQGASRHPSLYTPDKLGWMLVEI